MRVAYKWGRLTLFCPRRQIIRTHWLTSIRSKQHISDAILKKSFWDVGCAKPTCFFLKYWMCQAQVFFKCQMCQSPSVYMPYNALSDSFTEGSFIYSLPLHYINVTPLTAFQLNYFPIFAFYKMSKRQAYDVKLQTSGIHSIAISVMMQKIDWSILTVMSVILVGCTTDFAAHWCFHYQAIQGIFSWKIWWLVSSRHVWI